MHECPNCGQACDCIGDDTWDNTEAAYCQCDCDDDQEEGEWDIDEDEYTRWRNDING